MNHIQKVLFVLLTVFSFQQSKAQSELTSRINILVKYLEKEDLHSAYIMANDLIKDYPTNPQFIYNRGVMNLRLCNYYKAQEDFIKAKSMGYKFKDKYINYYTYPEYAVEKMSKEYFDSDTKLLKKNGFKPIFSRADSLRGYLSKERSCYDVYYYDLHVNVHPKSKSIDGINNIYFKVVTNTKKIQIDLFDNYSIKSIKWMGKNLDYQREANAILINFPDDLTIGSNHLLEISYNGKPIKAKNPPWNGGFVWKKQNFKPYTGVACEHIGASTWWPVKDHLSDKPDSMKITIGAPKIVSAISNGNLRQVYPINEEYNASEWFVSYPINSYNVTFYLGNFENFNESFTNSDGSYPIDYYVLKKNLNLAKTYYSKTSEIVQVFEELFGEYPFKNDGIGMVEAPYKGMEHQGAIAIGDDYKKPKYRGYDDYGYNFLLVHETAHEWWGNAIAIGDMADAWINEGFATYAEALLVEKKFDYSEYQKVIEVNVGHILNIMPLVGKKGVNDNTFFTGEIYSKGAVLLHNLRCVIDNDSLFFDIIKGFFKNQVYKITESSDFVNYVNKQTGQDLNPFFNKYLYDNKLPILEYYYSKDTSGIKLTYRWYQVEDGFRMPFSIKTNTKERIKLWGTTDFQTIQIKGAEFFNLHTLYNFDNETPKNSLTYYWTNLVIPNTTKMKYPKSNNSKVVMY